MEENTTVVRITRRQNDFLEALVQTGIFASKSEANRAGVTLLMEKYPQYVAKPKK